MPETTNSADLSNAISINIDWIESDPIIFTVKFDDNSSNEKANERPVSVNISGL
ncbi:hypothetical protein ENUP19_0274G0062 [Entamoeba nuttalli]|uniref:Uncharacterized protein n=1 Tax=Entamoeba nuttalli TaxID=412467 RepID=A0ABQ0DTA2_9EUKA